ncbi:hypothetical protein DAY19_08455 [Halobacteriovorax vibrionivorans]|uniref:Uncharacterized protein n=1 Tax=Halobacteriovorax vibrionivorans TaxID=2152716 RepID=A0ABY0IGS8_9BACT|nr:MULTISPECIES: hypothetical protein [Halobacteriovorax]RZF21710.1 hypothetical protein DAY19_08455 [Halobacteriovorax vibrionivorans]TGD46167.1 hypothetical protein EP118_13135 [Halobacteriovorax sp. Y22]
MAKNNEVTSNSSILKEIKELQKSIDINTKKIEQKSNDKEHFYKSLSSFDQELLLRAESRIASQTTFITILLAVLGFMTIFFSIKQFFSAKEIKELKDEIESHIQKKIFELINQQKKIDMIDLLTNYLSAKSYRNDYGATSLKLILHNKCDPTCFNMLNEHIDRLFASSSEENKRSLTQLIECLSNIKNDENIDQILLSFVNKISYFHNQYSPDPYHSLLIYFSDNVSKYEDQIIKLLDFELKSYESDAFHQGAYHLSNKVLTEKIINKIIELIAAFPHLIESFQNSPDIIDSFLDSSYEEVVDLDGIINNDNEKLKRNSNATRVSAFNNRESYLYKKAQELKEKKRV